MTINKCPQYLAFSPSEGSPAKRRYSSGWTSPRPRLFPVKYRGEWWTTIKSTQAQSCLKYLLPYIDVAINLLFVFPSRLGTWSGLSRRKQRFLLRQMVGPPQWILAGKSSGPVCDQNESELQNLAANISDIKLDTSIQYSGQACISRSRVGHLLIKDEQHLTTSWGRLVRTTRVACHVAN